MEYEIINRHGRIVARTDDLDAARAYIQGAIDIPANDPLTDPWLRKKRWQKGSLVIRFVNP